MARPGTVDYSKWERMAAEMSSSDEEEKEAAKRRRTSADMHASGLLTRAQNAQQGHRENHETENDADEYEEDGAEPVTLQTGTCLHCGRQGADQRCSRCQAAWFCDRTCQASAWKSHSVECFAKSETDAWWGILGDSTEARSTTQGSSVAHQQRLEFRRVVAATRERRKAAAAAAARAAAMRQQEGISKGGDAKGGKGGGQKEETCAVCQCEFTTEGDTGEGICCPSSHFLCSECTGVFVQSIMNDLEASFPPKCSMCRAEIPVEAFERQLSTRQNAQYAEFVTQRSLALNEHMVKCECGHMEIRQDQPVLWWCAVCKRGQCQVCHKELPMMEDTDLKMYMEAGSVVNSKAKEVDMLLRPHVQGCASLREFKVKVDKALTNGQKMPCPQCGLAGMKDDACTHMTCSRCHVPWCYICGLSVDRCDKAPPRQPGLPANDIFLHNVDWETNPLRCPMYLTQILEVDPAWLGQDWDQGDEIDDDRCLSYFHRWRTIKLLQDVRSEIGAEAFNNVWLHFDSVRNSGYELEEIIHTDTSVLIDREAWQAEDGDSDLSVDNSEEDDSDEDDAVVSAQEHDSDADQGGFTTGVLQ